MGKGPERETDLYGPVKALLEGQGYTVKGEVGTVDLMAVRGDEDPVIVELKLRFSLAFFHQAIARQRITDAVYIAVAHREGAAFSGALKANIALCRRLGLGLLTVRFPHGTVLAHADPAPYRPSRNKRRRTRLLREFARRVGDPNTGGATRRNLVTAYRQDALRCLAALHENGPTKAATVAELTGVATARRVMADNHYGWFERVSRGIYRLGPAGEQAMIDHAEACAALRVPPRRD